jgi:hypothetical protein
MMRTAFLCSLWLGAIVLVPSGAHLLEAPQKLAMDRATYFNTQQLYLGWALFGVPIAVKIVLDATIAFVLMRTWRRAACCAAVSAALIASGLVVFFLCVQPANSATSNWSRQPPDWETLRRSWEYGHMAIAVLTLMAFGATTYGTTTVFRTE